MLLRVRDGKEQGFTLVEIALVMALAGFVFVIILVAITGTQRSRRDAHRKSDINSIFGTLETYNSAQSKYPATGAFGTFFGTNYVTSLNLKDPSSQTDYVVGSGWPAVAATGTVYYRFGQTCDGSVTLTGYSVKMGLEVGEVCRELE
jgi:type II secretory pathway pseudopilin PulG